MRKLSFIVVFLFAAQLRALVSPCNIPVVAPSEVFTSPNQIVVFGGHRPIGMCGYQFTTSTPDVIAIDSVEFTDTSFTIRVTTLAPGEGILIVFGTLPGGSDYRRTAATIHVDSCEEGAHAVSLPPTYSVARPAPVHIEPQIGGSFPRGFVWLVNGIPWNFGPTFDFVPSGTGTFTITLRAESLCGIVEATTLVNVGPQRTRLVRRR
jgi:hypothetical protein